MLSRGSEAARSISERRLTPLCLAIDTPAAEAVASVLQFPKPAASRSVVETHHRGSPRTDDRRLLTRSRRRSALLQLGFASEARFHAIAKDELRQKR
jgi:hypothetical protein